MANPQVQLNGTVFGSLSAAITSIFTIIVVASVKGSTLIDHALNTSINFISAAERISVGVDKRAEIYATGMVRNGDLAEREATLKLQLRLNNLIAQEASAGTPKPVKAKPAKTTRKAVTKPAKANGSKHVPASVAV